MNDAQIHWRGAGRWLSFLIAAVLIVASIPNFASLDSAIAVGVNIFLGLLLFATVAAGNRRAPLVLLVLVALTALHLVGALALRHSILGAMIEGALLMLTFLAWLDLTRQAGKINQEGPERVP